MRFLDLWLEAVGGCDVCGEHTVLAPSITLRDPVTGRITVMTRTYVCGAITEIYQSGLKHHVSRCKR